VAATYFYYVSSDEEIRFFEDDRNKDDSNNDDIGNRTRFWKLFSAARIMTTATATATATTHCLAIGDLKETSTTSRRQKDGNKSSERPRLIFLGTGSSTGCPKPICAMKFQNNFLSMAPSSDEKTAQTVVEDSSAPSPTPPVIKPDPTSCQISYRALAGGDPKTNRDYRNNPSLLIHHYDEHSKRYKNIIIDVGKTFRETALRWFPINGVESLDAIILTHHHMDAAAGLDDVRGFQGIKWIADVEEKEENETTNCTNDSVNNPGPERQPGRYVRQSIPLYMSSFCQLNLQSQFPWLLPKKSGSSVMPQQAKDRPTVKRDVASFDVTIFKDYQEEVILGAEQGGDNTQPGGLKIVPLPVWHGDDLISHGFAFSLHPGPSLSSSSRSMNVVYLSDISRMVPKTLEFIQKELPPTDILIVDSLNWDKTHPVHYSLEQAVDLSRTLQPRMRTYLIGMSCDKFLPNDEMNAYLRETYGNGGGDRNDNDGAIVMAHDGLIIELPDNKT